MLYDAFTGLCEIDKGIKFMITTNFDLQNQPLERGVASQALALPHSSTGGRDATHSAHPSVPFPDSILPPELFFLFLNCKQK